jgi:formate dehydrogenase major subunit
VTTCDVRPGPRPRGQALLAYVEDYRRRAGVTPQTGARAVTVDVGHDGETDSGTDPEEGR